MIKDFLQKHGEYSSDKYFKDLTTLKTKYDDDEKKITKAEIKISIPDDGIPEENYYSYVPYEYHTYMQGIFYIICS